MAKGTSFGGTIKLTGEDDYKKALRDITSNLKLVSSELKLANTEFSTGDKTVKQTKASYDNMNKTMQDQKSKVNELREILSKMEKEYGSNSDKVKDFRTQLNNAENKLNQMEEATNKSTKELREMQKGFSGAGDGALQFSDILKANILGDVIFSGLKELGNLAKEIGSTFVNIGKQALDSYADFEQLEGGVKKLFGTQSETVEDYAKSVGKTVDEVKDEYNNLIKAQQNVFDDANNAYKIAGMSANEYMEVVTGFSASMINSLNGDTVKASEYAKQAIVDMADNANTFGTDLASIQNAYQGFAKQNYTMLDNLKLGYGGTKSEMERLISDANRVKEANGEMANLSIDSFADITEAIHIMQSEQNISGTTAKEASTTIQGSVESMKSAWQNLLVGLASDSADFNQLVNNLINSIMGDDGIGGVFNNIMPRIEIIINGIVQLVMSLADRLVEYMPTLLETGMNLLQTILDGIMSMLPQTMPVAVELINNLSTFILQNLPTILQAGITLLLELIKGITQTLPQLMPVAVQCIMDLVNTLLDNIDEVIECGIQLLVALTDGIFNALPELISRLPEIIVKITTKLIELTPQLLSCVLRLITSIATGMVKYSVEIVTRIPEIIKSIVNGLLSGVKDMINIGKNLVEGIWSGISNSFDWIKNKLKNWVGDVTKFIKKLFGINSPSKLFKEEIGTNLALGLGEGFSDTMKDVTESMANSIPTELDTTINSNYNSSSSGFNSATFDNAIDAFKVALKDVKIILDDREMGSFVTGAVEEVVYS